VTAPNRFYQVPHCTAWATTCRRPGGDARGQSRGGWGTVCTEYCSIHPTSDDHPSPFASLWDQGDVANLRVLVEGVHRHGSLCGVELWHGGLRSANLLSRQTPIGPNSLPADKAPLQARRMDLADIRDYRRAHRAALYGRGKRAPTWSMSMPATPICSRNSSILASTAAFPATAARSRTAPASSAS
jgi:dimethylamine/trimethylamine dehydrogenase